MMEKNTIQLLNEFMGNLDVEGICGFWIDEERDDHDMLWVYIILDLNFLKSIQTKPGFVAQRMRTGVKEEIKKFLGIDVQVGSISRDCDKLV